MVEHKTDYGATEFRSHPSGWFKQVSEAVDVKLTAYAGVPVAEGTDTGLEAYLDVPELTDEIVFLRPCKQLLEVRPTACGTRFYAIKTKDGRQLLDPWRDPSGGHRHECPICSRQEASRLAVADFHRLMALPWNYVMGITLTTPVDFAWLGETLTDTKKELMRRGQEYMKRAHPKLNGSQIAFQHWKSSNPLGGWWYHLHITVPCARYTREDDMLGYELLPAYQSKEKLEEYRRIWADILDVPGKVDIDYKYISRKTVIHEDGTTSGGPGRLMHWLRYVYRAYVQDVEKFFLKNETEQWTEDTRVSFEKHQVDCGRRIASYGVLSNSTRGRYIDLETVKQRIQEHHDVGRARYDPDTGEELTGKFDVVTIDGPVHRSQLVAHYHVEYWDIPYVSKPWVVYRTPPFPCPTWGHHFVRLVD